MFKYIPKTDKIKVQTTSDGDLSAMLDELNEGQVQYVFIRFKVSADVFFFSKARQQTLVVCVAGQ